VPLRKVGAPAAPPKPVPAAKTFKHPAQERVRKPEPAQKDETEDKGVPRTVTVRLHPKHYDMLQAIVDARETDKSDALKYLIRTGFQAYSAHDAELTLTDTAGRITTIPIVNNGKPA
jgi:hypothetical protein